MTIEQISEAREGFIDEFANLLRSYRTKLSASQIKALNTTPQTIVPAPGANKIIALETVIVFLDYSGGAFTMAGNNLEVRETNGVGTSLLASGGDITAAFMQGTADAIVEQSAEVFWGQTTRIADAPIVAFVPVADPGGAAATSSIFITALYRIIQVNH